MENAYQPELWRDLYVMLGTSSAALIGLLFVVMSLHHGEIRKNPVFYIRAHNITLHLLTTLIEAALILTPQPMVILGVELVALNLFGLRLPVVFVYRYFYKNRKVGTRGSYSIPWDGKHRGLFVRHCGGCLSHRKVKLGSLLNNGFFCHFSRFWNSECLDDHVWKRRNSNDEIKLMHSVSVVQHAQTAMSVAGLSRPWQVSRNPCSPKPDLTLPRADRQLYSAAVSIWKFPEAGNSQETLLLGRPSLTA